MKSRCTDVKQIPGLSRTFNLNFQDFSGPNSFQTHFKGLKILQIKVKDFPGGVGALFTAKHSIITENNYTVLTDFSQL